MSYNNASFNNVVERLSRKNRYLAMIFKNVEDKFSMLPEEIVTHILSLMPTIYAVRTSVLSKRWRYAWMHVTNLEFDDTQIDFYHFASFVDQVLKLCKTSQVKLFRLHSHEFAAMLSVSNWIDEAVRLKACEIDIQVERMELPLSMLTCKTLTKLRLDWKGINYMWLQGWKEFPCEVNLPCMKTLDMTFNNNHYVNAFKLINGCPVLESLSWKVIQGHNDAEDYTFNIPTLKRLKLALRNCASNKVVLHAPNLEYLSVGGMLSSVYLMKDVSSLVEASVSFCEIRSGHDHDHLWAKLLKGLRGVKILSFQNISSTFRLPCFPNMKHLKLTSSWNSASIVKFLESSPELKHVYIEKVQESPWIEPKLVPTCMLTNLTTIKFYISKWWKCDTAFLEYMLANAEVLKALTIIPEYSSNIKEEQLLCAELLKFPRASRCCEMHLNKILWN